MFFIKVLLHHVLFLLSFIGLHYYFDLNVYFTILALVHVYGASYFVSLWIIKFIFLFPCTKIKTENKCVLITGCDSGFGHKAALLLNKAGFKVFASCIDPNGEGAVELMLKAVHSARMVVFRMDVTNDKDIEAAYDTVTSSMTNAELLFGLVNNAGIANATEFEWGPDLTDGKRIIEVNLMGMISVTRKFLPLIRQAKGRIVNIESLSGLLPIPNGIFYGTSKYGAAGFSENLRIAMYRFGVSVVSINPWIYKTPISNAKMLSHQYESCFRTSSEEVRSAYGEKFMEKGKSAVSAMKLATESNAVPDVIVSALTVYEPDPRYIVAPIILQPALRVMLWLPKETFESYYQLVSWLVGTHKVYPEPQSDNTKSTH